MHRFKGYRGAKYCGYTRRKHQRFTEAVLRDSQARRIEATEQEGSEDILGRRIEDIVDASLPRIVHASVPHIVDASLP
jgi:hypothetical protein